MNKAFFLLALIAVLCALVGCRGAGGSVALDVSERPAGPRPQPAPTPGKTPSLIVIATGSIDMDRVFNQQTGGIGTDLQQDSGQAYFEVRQRKDWFDSG